MRAQKINGRRKVPRSPRTNWESIWMACPRNMTRWQMIVQLTTVKAVKQTIWWKESIRFSWRSVSIWKRPKMSLFSHCQKSVRFGSFLSFCPNIPSKFTSWWTFRKCSPGSLMTSLGSRRSILARSNSNSRRKMPLRLVRMKHYWRNGKVSSSLDPNLKMQTKKSWGNSYSRSFDLFIDNKW